MKQKEEFLECEKLWIYIVMIIVGGFMGAYTYILKGKVFCNAQTANFLMLAVQIGSGEWERALYYIIPITAYLTGIMLSEFLPKHVNKLGLLRWETFLIALEMLCLLILGFLPDSVPYQVFQISINFIASMQFNTFRQAESMTMATLFCTNHLRQVGVNLVKWFRKHDGGMKTATSRHLVMLVAFVVGSSVSTALCLRFGGRAIWFAEIPLVIVFVDLLTADLGREKDKLNVVPHGH